MPNDNKSPGFWQTVPGILTAVAGIMTAGAGLMLALYQTGLIGNKVLPSNSSQSSIVAASGATPTSNSPAQSGTVLSAATPAANITQSAPGAGSASVTDEPRRSADQNEFEVNIAGDWYDTEGTFYRIQQNGNQFSGDAFLGPIRSKGTGTLRGRDLSSQFSTNRPSNGNCTGTVSADGNSILSKCWDDAIGPFNTSMRRARN